MRPTIITALAASALLHGTATAFGDQPASTGSHVGQSGAGGDAAVGAAGAPGASSGAQGAGGAAGSGSHSTGSPNSLGSLGSELDSPGSPQQHGLSQGPGSLKSPGSPGRGMSAHGPGSGRSRSGGRRQRKYRKCKAQGTCRSRNRSGSRSRKMLSPSHGSPSMPDSPHMAFSQDQDGSISPPSSPASPGAHSPMSTSGSPSTMGHSSLSHPVMSRRGLPQLDTMPSPNSAQPGSPQSPSSDYSAHSPHSPGSAGGPNMFGKHSATSYMGDHPWSPAAHDRQINTHGSGHWHETSRHAGSPGGMHSPQKFGHGEHFAQGTAPNSPASGVPESPHGLAARGFSGAASKMERRWYTGGRGGGYAGIRRPPYAEKYAGSSPKGNWAYGAGPGRHPGQIYTGRKYHAQWSPGANQGPQPQSPGGRYGPARG